MQHSKVSEFESLLEVQLPIEYKEFLIKNDGLSFDYYPFEVLYNEELVEFGVNHIDSLVDVKINSNELLKFNLSNLNVNNCYISDVESFISIAIDVNSFNILLGVKGQYYDKIYLLNKENVYPSYEIENFLIDNSFAEFFAKCMRL